MADNSVDVLDSRTVYEGFFRVFEVKARYRRPNGEFSDWVDRAFEERGDAVAILLWIRNTKELVFVRQFRVAMMRHNDAFPLEVVAGSVDPGESAEQAAIRELQEEVGFMASELQRISEYYGSPGGLSEKVTLFFVGVDAIELADTGGLEGEDLKIVRLGLDDVYRMLEAGQIRDGKTLACLNWFFLFGEGRA